MWGNIQITIHNPDRKHILSNLTTSLHVDNIELHGTI